ncbi:MAG: hypothetical protein EZS28_052067, partial [Streblomastix strix]
YITFREVNFEDSDALMLTEPMLSAPFRRQVRLHRLKYPHEETQVQNHRFSDKLMLSQDNNEPTRYYYHNHITDQYTAEQHLRNVYQKERHNHFKISIDFGFIKETVTYTSEDRRSTVNLRFSDGTREVTYSSVYPRTSLSPLNIQALITSEADMERYIQYLSALIIENQERTLDDTHTRFVAIVSMVAVVYRIPLAGRAIPALEKFIKRREVHYIESPYPNNCFFEALSYLSKPDQERRLRQSERVSEGVQLMIQYYGLQGNSAKCKTVQQFITNYQGFNIASEAKQIAKTFNINI